MMDEKVTPIRVLLVDDVEQARQDLGTALNLFENIEIIGEAGNGMEAIYKVQSLRPDVILMDLEMPVMDGYESTQRIKSIRPCKIIALTIHDYESARSKAKRSGVDTFLVKGTPVTTIVQAIIKKE